ncbi:MAG: undecaprenyldiphospho-muramoylpentapeptide beta-N-acetylglucosaminyltransferase [Eubacteriales bacterium]|nr:undecaprenyldiphospho-muramoylpentapeptide beta-N-acetylglucosaminyltransferase [Eubacteriales bacterium]
MKVLLAGGGTAGHVNPAIAIAGEIKKNNPDAQILFIGTKKGLESTLVPKAGFDIEFVEVSGFKRSLSPKNIAVTLKAAYGVVKAISIIRKFKPDVAIGTGGYVSGPTMYGAHLCKVPVMIHEQNVFPGATNRMVNSFARVTAISFEDSRRYFKNTYNITLTGNPIKRDLFAASAKAIDKPSVLIMGGSLGAEAINNGAVALILNNKGKYNITLSTGKGDYERVVKLLADKGLDVEKDINVNVVSYIYDTPQAYADSQLVIARSGAITVSELAALGKPSILIPSPNVTHNHQEYNAKALADSGGAVMIKECDLTDDILIKTVNELLDNPQKLSQMSRAASRAGICDAASSLCKIAIAIAKK